MRVKASVGYRLAAFWIALAALACEEVEERPVPPRVTSPQTPTATPPERSTGGASGVEEVGPPAPAPPWPRLDVVAGRFSPEFAREYVDLVRSEREAFDTEMAKTKEPPKTPQEATHRRISEKGRRQRLMDKPRLDAITDEQISDVLSFNPDMASGANEFERLLAAHPNNLSICVDHGRWLLFKKRRSDAIAEYQRCARIPGISQDQLRYVQTAIAGAKNAPP